MNDFDTRIERGSWFLQCKRCPLTIMVDLDALDKVQSMTAFKILGEVGGLIEAHGTVCAGKLDRIAAPLYRGSSRLGYGD